MLGAEATAAVATVGKMMVESRSTPESDDETLYITYPFMWFLFGMLLNLIEAVHLAKKAHEILRDCCRKDPVQNTPDEAQGTRSTGTTTTKGIQTIGHYKRKDMRPCVTDLRKPTDYGVFEAVDVLERRIAVETERGKEQEWRRRNAQESCAADSNGCRGVADAKAAKRHGERACRLAAVAAFSNNSKRSRQS